MTVRQPIDDRADRMGGIALPDEAARGGLGWRVALGLGSFAVWSVR